jgi:class 3 adenylate cyclase
MASHVYGQGKEDGVIHNPPGSSNADTLVLIVDDNEINRYLLSRLLKQQGYAVVVAEDGLRGLTMMRNQRPDLVLLDIVMPELNGYQVLEQVRTDPVLRHTPIVIITAVDDIESVIRCIELGAEDYLFKPFNPVLLKARIDASLEKKRLRDHEQAYLKQLEEEQEKSERLLLNILPKPIADRLKQGQNVIADSFLDVTVLFADIVGFTHLSDFVSPTVLVELLNDIFSAFDRLVERYDLEKIKTIGDSYMVAGGLPLPRADHAEAIAAMALDMQQEIAKFQTEYADQFHMRIGIHTGPVVAGVIGHKKFTYDMWGDTVNIASRMELHGVAGRIQVTETTYQRLQDGFRFEPRGYIDVKGKGQMKTYFLVGQ